MEVLNGVEVDTEKLKRDWEENGFVVLRDFIPKTETAKVRQRAAEMLEAFDPQKEMEKEGLHIFSCKEQTKEQKKISDEYFLNSAGKIRCFFEEDAFDENKQLKQSKEHSINKIGHAMHDLDPVFNQFSRQHAFKRIAEILGYQKPLLLQTMYIFKQPKIGGEVVPHQDSTFLYTDPLSCMGFWVALEAADKTNGCLWAIPGSHKDGLRDGRRFVKKEDNQTTMVPPKNGEYEDWKDESKYVPVECGEGSLVLIHGSVVHMSYANTSEKSRQAFTLHIVDGAADYPQDNWLQREEPFRGF